MTNSATVVALVALVVGPAVAHAEVVRPLVGFGVFALGGLTALIAAVAAVVRRARGGPLGAGGLVALLAATAFVASAGRGAGHPRINDFTTDPSDPPRFVNALQIDANRGRDMGYPAHFASDQRACCADLRPVTLPLAPAAAYARALELATGMPDWQVLRADAAANEIEAVATSKLFRFKDDIVIRVRPDGADGARVDVRSKSRDGKGDMGANAARIRTVLAALSASR